MDRNRWIPCAIILVLLAGCDLFGPSPKDVKAALEAVDRALESSARKGMKPEVHSEYINAADVTYTAGDRSTVHSMSFFLDTDTGAGSINGECVFSDYRDAPSGYTINSSFKYDFKEIKKSSIDDMYGSIDCSVRLAGGKISSLDASFSEDKDGVLIHSIKADGREVDMQKWEKAFQVIRSLHPGTLPR